MKALQLKISSLIPITVALLLIATSTIARQNIADKTPKHNQLKHSKMENNNYTFSFESSKSQSEMFEVLIDVRQWWSGLFGEEITGESKKNGDEFTFRAGDGLHYTKHRLVELIPNEKIVWQVIESKLAFVDKTDEWTGTVTSFEITKKGSNNLVTFTHQGLVPKFQCYENCAGAWTQYLEKLEMKLNAKDFTSTIMVGKTPMQAFDAIKDFRAWWSEDIEGNTDQLGETFFYHYKDVHLCKIKLIEMKPGKKLVYEVVANEFSFTKDKTEWVGTKIIFDISKEGSQTKVVLTHKGLVPEYECYNVCHDAWTGFIKTSLKKLIDTGMGQPNPKDGTNQINAENLKKWAIKQTTE